MKKWTVPWRLRDTGERVEVEMDAETYKLFTALRAKIVTPEGEALLEGEALRRAADELHTLVELTYYLDAEVIEVREPEISKQEALAEAQRLEDAGSPFVIPQKVKEQLASGQTSLLDSDGQAARFPQPDPAAARAAKEEAIKRVDRAADVDWKDRCDAVIEELCREKAIFTPDDVWQRIEKPVEPRALGPRMIVAKNKGLCEPTGRLVKSAMPTQHQNVIAEYRSLIYQGREANTAEA